jgi:hypothetical protein
MPDWVAINNSVMQHRIDALENYLRTLRDVTPHQWLKDEINETLGTPDGDEPDS